IDSEREKDVNESAKAFLESDFPNYDFKNVEESQFHFMVQAMESWFLGTRKNSPRVKTTSFTKKLCRSTRKLKGFQKMTR
ncbi:MAG: hypothetical protein ACR2IA_00215, partial [Pyrinomonadaceae bacterium]